MHFTKGFMYFLNTLRCADTQITIVPNNVRDIIKSVFYTSRHSTDSKIRANMSNTTKTKPHSNKPDSLLLPLLSAYAIAETQQDFSRKDDTVTRRQKKKDPDIKKTYTGLPVGTTG